VGHTQPSYEPLANGTVRRLEQFRQYVQQHQELAHLLP